MTEDGRCPSCSAVSSKVHDRYIRRPFDLPWRGQSVRLVLTVRRFRCTNSACRRATFAQDCGPNLPRYARRTLEASEHLLTIAKASGGEAGARIANNSGLSVSPDTLLRLLRRLPLPTSPTLRVLGIDDFALRRGQVYGTIFLDLESRRPIDIVEGREMNCLVDWLQEHPGIEIIVRDRWGPYAEGAKLEAPKATQVADRFHLVRNASRALDLMLRGHRLKIDETEAASIIRVGASALANGNVDGVARLSPTEQMLANRRSAHLARWQKVKALADAGVSLRQIGREVEIDPRTAKRLINTPEPSLEQPINPRPGGLRSRKLQPYVTYLQDRWQAGCTNISKLHREIVEQGFSGTYECLSEAIRSWRPPRLPFEERRKVRRKTRRSAMRWICLRPPEQLKPEEKTLLEKLLSQDDRLAMGHKLLQEFRRLVADRDPPGLETWLAEAKSSNLPTFVGLANGIEVDRDAVNAGLTFEWSTGPVEGHINRLKLIKRQGYGRAKFDLLRARVLVA